ADGGKPARHVAQLLPDAGGVHQEEHRRMSGAIGSDAEGLHGAVLGRDVQRLLDHVRILPRLAYAIGALLVRRGTPSARQTPLTVVLAVLGLPGMEQGTVEFTR